MKYKIVKKGNMYAIYVKKSWWRRYEGLYHEGVNRWGTRAAATNHITFLKTGVSITDEIEFSDGHMSNIRVGDKFVKVHGSRW